MLKCTNVWVSNTGATQHPTFSTIGGINKQECNIRCKGQMGTATNTSIVMDSCVKLCDIQGHCYGKAVLKDVQVGSKFNYNMFSINLMLKDGFTVSGNSDMLALVHNSDKQTMIFDIKITTDSNFLLAGYMQ